MLIVVERIAARDRRLLQRRCSVIDCAAVADWYLADRDMPESHAANLGRVACCTAHIVTAYLSLRGAHVIALAQPPVLVRKTRRLLDRRHAARRHAAVAGAAGEVAAERSAM